MVSVFPRPQSTAWILALRPPKAAALDPRKPRSFFLEEELAQNGRAAQCGVILLTNKECPWRCVMCDLWKNTTSRTVPLGAIPHQIEFALRTWRQAGCVIEHVKLYNSGSFFDAAAIPPSDYSAIARKISFAQHVVVESHPRLVGARVLRLRDLLQGSLEVAMGLETAHPDLLRRLNKRFELTHFVQAADFLRREQIAVRAFVLVNPPFMSQAEGAEWVVKSADFAFCCGASVVSLIPTRSGNGAMDQLLQQGQFSPPTLSTLEKALELTLDLPRRGRVFADTWDLGQFSACSACLERRQERLRLMNRLQQLLPAVGCQACGGA